jgi:hypothetical protein
MACLLGYAYGRSDEASSVELCPVCKQTMASITSELEKMTAERVTS